jgi:hypothetical protein
MKPSPYTPRAFRPTFATAVFLAVLSIVLQGALSRAHAGVSYYWSNIAGYPGGFGNVDGQRANARFGGPQAICADGLGNFYVADQDAAGSGFDAIRKISSNGLVSTLVPAAAGYAPIAVAADNLGNVYFIDSDTEDLDVVNSAGVVTELADGLNFFSPTGVALDNAGNIYVADSGAATVWQVDSSGDVNPLSSNFFGPISIAYDPQTGTLLVGDNDGSNGYIDELTPEGAVTTDVTMPGVNPAGIAVDNSGNVYCSDSANDGLILASLSNGTYFYVAPANPQGAYGIGGYVNGPAANAQFSTLEGIASDSSGDILIADSGNGCIREYNTSAVVTTFAGAPPPSFNRDGTNVIASFAAPDGVAVDGTGNILVADALNQDIRKLSNTGIVSTVVSPAILTGTTAGTSTPAAIAIDSGGNAYIADSGASVIWKVSAGGSLSLFAGAINITGTGNGPALSARFNAPSGIAVDGSGNVYVADSGNDTIRVITADGAVSTLAGQPGVAGAQDGVGSGAQFTDPQGITVDGSGTVYVADSGNGVIRLIPNSGSTQTNSASGDLVEPYGIALDGSGGVFVSDAFEGSIYDVGSDGSATYLAGSGSYGAGVDGAGANATGNLLGLAIDPHGNVDIADGTGSIRQMTPAGAVSTLAGFAGPTGLVPSGVAVDGSDNLLIFNPANEDLIRINPSGIGTVIFPGAITSASALALDGSGNIFALEATKSGSLVEIGTNGNVSVKATEAAIEAVDPGLGPDVLFSYIALDKNDNIYGTASSFFKGPLSGSYLYKVSTSGSASLVVSGSPGDHYSGIALDSSGDIYFANLFSVQEIASGTTTPVIYAGSSTSGTANGVGSLAQFGGLAGLALDGSNNLYVADSGNLTVREIAPGGSVSTIGGTPGTAGGANGIGAAAEFGSGGAINGPGLGAMAAAPDGSAVYLVDDRVAKGLAGTNFVTPTLSTVGIASSGASGTSAVIGNTITVSFTASTAIQTPGVTIDGSPASVVNVSGNAWKASIIVGSETPAGLVSFDISYQSLAGISGVDGTETTDGSHVTVIPPPPALTSVSIASTDAISSTEATIGDEINLNFTSNIPIIAPTVTIAGQTATVSNLQGDTWQASITVVAASPSGPVAFSIGNLTSTLGVSGTTGPVTATTDGSQVTITPSLLDVSIASTDTENGNALPGDSIYLLFTATGPIQTPTVTIDGQAATVTYDGSNSWTASIVLSGTAVPNSQVPFNISFESTGGTPGIPVSSTTDGSYLFVSGPSLNFVSIASNDAQPGLAKAGDIVTLIFTGNEQILPSSVSIDNHTVIPVNEAGNTWKASLTVGAGDVQSTPYAAPFTIRYASVSSTSTIFTQTGTTDGSTVIIGNSLPQPSVSNVLISGGGSVGSTVNVSFNSSEPIQLPSVMIAKRAASVFHDSGNSWRANIIVTPADIIAVTGTYVPGVTGTVPFSIQYQNTLGVPGNTYNGPRDSYGDTAAIGLAAPALNDVTIASNSALGNYEAAPGDVVTLEFDASSPITSPTVTMLGRAVPVVHAAGNTYSAAVTVTGSDQQGAVPFNITFNNGTSVSDYNYTTDFSYVYVVPPPVPTLNTVSIYSSDGNPTLAQPGETVTLAFTSSQPIMTPTVMIAGAAASVSSSGAGGTNWTASVAVTGASPNGPVNFSIAYHNTGGIAGPTLNYTTDGSSVDIIAASNAPTLYDVSIASNGPDPTQAAAGDAITLTFHSSKVLQTPQVTIAGRAATVTSTGTNQWSAAITVSGSDAAASPVGFSISFQTIGGVGGTAVNTTSDGSSVNIIPNVAPTLTTVSIGTSNGSNVANPGDAVSLTFTADRRLATPAVEIAGRAATILSEGSDSWYAYIVVTGSDTLGPVPFVINYTSLGGLAGEPVQVTTDSSSVTIAGAPAPQLQTVGIRSSDANHEFAAPGDTITLQFISQEPIEAPAVTIAGRSATVSGTGTAWTGVIQVTGSDPTGPAQFTIEFKNTQGVPGAPVSQTQDGSSVTIGPAASDPTLYAVNISSNDFNDEAVALPGDSIILTFNSSEPIRTPAVTINNLTANVSDLGDGHWQAELLLGSGTGTGVVPFSIAYQTLSGSASGTVTATTDFSNVIIPPENVPAINEVNITSSDADPTYATVGDVISVTFDTSTAVQLPQVAILGRTATVVETGSNQYNGVLYQATITVTGSDPYGSPFFTIDCQSTAGIPAATFDSMSGNFSGSVTVGPPLTEPSLYSVTLNSSNYNSTIAQVGDVITLAFASTIPIQTPQVTIENRPAAVTSTGTDSYSATITVTGSDAYGNVPFTIDFTSTAGVAGAEVTQTTDGSALSIVPAVPPTLPYVSIASSDTDDFSQAVPGSVITLYITADEPLNTPAVTIAGGPAVVTGSGTYFQASVVVSSTDAQGVAPFSIAFGSATGNAGIPVTETTDGSTVAIVAPPAPDLELSLHGQVPGAAGSTTFQTFGATEPDSFYGTEKTPNGKTLKGIFSYTGNLIVSATTSGGYKAFGQPNGDAVVATGSNGKPVIVTGLLSGTATQATLLAGSPAIRSILAIDGYLNSSQADTFFLADVSGIKGVSTALGVVRSGTAYFIVANSEKLAAGAISKLTTFTTSPGTPAQGRWRGDDFSFGIRVTFKNGTEAVYGIPDSTTPITISNFATLSPTGWTLYGSTGVVGNSIPGLPSLAIISSLGLPGFGGSYFSGYGVTEAHIVNLKLGAPISSSNDSAIVSAGTVIARKGSPAPDVNGNTSASGPFYHGFSDPVCGAYGDIAFEATLAGSGVKAADNTGIWYQSADSTPYLVARTGSVAPDTNGAKFSGFTSMVLPSYNFPGDGPVFIAKLIGTNVNSLNNLSLWGVNNAGLPQLLLRTGASIQVNGTSEVLHTFTALVAEPGASGAASGYDAEGIIAVYATFKDGSHALLHIATP